MGFLSKSDISELLEKIVGEISKDLHPRKIILFGSFARGDAVQRSDIDLAIDLGGPFDDMDWLNFLHQFSEKNLTLRKIEILRMDKVSKDIKESIEQEGVTLYESK